MKRTLSIVLLLVCVLAASAQIQRKFLGFTLGVTTKTQVYNYLKNHHYKFSKNDIEDGYRVKNVSFGGHQWPSVTIAFYKNKFYSIRFYDSDYYVTSGTLEAAYDYLGSLLDTKYYDYYRTDTSSTQRKCYMDDVVYCVLGFSHSVSGCSLSLSYYQIPLTEEIIRNINSDL